MELTTDSEMRAESMTPAADGTTPDLVTQLRTLLSLKLSDHWADYLALENQEPDLVVRQHHRAILRYVFGVLIGEGVQLAPKADLPPPPPEILPPPPTPVIDEEEVEEDDEELDAIPEPEPIVLDDEDDDELEGEIDGVTEEDSEPEVSAIEGEEQPDDPSETTPPAEAPAEEPPKKA